MRIVFMGTDNIALPAFHRLLGQMEVVGLVTQPDRPVGRHQIMMPPALKPMAEDACVPVFQPVSLRAPQAIEQIASWRPDLIVVMAYGQILPDSLIQMAPCGCINVHASLLPRHRGASCIASAIRSGDRETGISIIDVASRLDAGDVLKAKGFAMMGKETAAIMHHRLSEMAPNVLMDAIHDIAQGTVRREPQDETLVTYAPKLKRHHGLIDWTMEANEIERIVRAYDSWPGTFTLLRDRKGRQRKLKIFPYCDVHQKKKGEAGEIVAINEKGIMVACGEGSLMIHSVQPEGGRKMPVCDFVVGNALSVGDVFERVIEE